MGDSNFEQNWRRQQELRMRPIADNIYRSCWGDNIKIERIERLADFVLDKFFGIDVLVTFPTGMIITGQEKFLSPKYATYKSLTVEHMNDPSHKGDWFNLASQFYFCGYASKAWDSFQLWVIVNWLELALATLQKNIKWFSNNNQHDNARATFRYCRISEIPKECLIKRSN